MSMFVEPDYLAIGHLTIDTDASGTHRLGGTVLYSAMLAARFGLRSAILTRGSFSGYGERVDRELGILAESVEIILQDADEPTRFTNISTAGRRAQRIHSWAGPIDVNGLPTHWRSAGIIHLGPVAQEIDTRHVGRLSPDYFGITPQGLMRAWQADPLGRVSSTPLRLPHDLLGRLDAMVLNSEEQTLARDDVAAIGSRGLVAITRGGEGVELIDRGRSIPVAAPRIRAVDDTGAGDVFAAALFMARAAGEATVLAGMHATAAAALLIERGGIASIPDRETVDQLAQSLLADAQAGR